MAKKNDTGTTIEGLRICLEILEHQHLSILRLTDNPKLKELQERMINLLTVSLSNPLVKAKAREKILSAVQELEKDELNEHLIKNFLQDALSLLIVKKKKTT